MNAKTRAADGKWDFKFFIIITNVFVITKAIALFLLIMVIITTNIVP